MDDVSVSVALEASESAAREGGDRSLEYGGRIVRIGLWAVTSDSTSTYIRISFVSRLSSSTGQMWFATPEALKLGDMG